MNSCDVYCLVVVRVWYLEWVLGVRGVFCLITCCLGTEFRRGLADGFVIDCKWLYMIRLLLVCLFKVVDLGCWFGVFC